MEVSSSMPSAGSASGAAAQDELGLAAMFESADADAADGVDADSFAALMQAFLAAAFPTPPPPEVREKFPESSGQPAAPAASDGPAESCATPPASPGGTKTGTGVDGTTALATGTAPPIVAETTPVFAGGVTEIDSAPPAPASSGTVAKPAPPSDGVSAPPFLDAALSSSADGKVIGQEGAAEEAAGRTPVVDPSSENTFEGAEAAFDESAQSSTAIPASILVYIQAQRNDATPVGTPSPTAAVDPHRTLLHSKIETRAADDDLFLDETEFVPPLTAAEFAAARTVMADSDGTTPDHASKDEHAVRETASSAADHTASPESVIGSTHPATGPSGERNQSHVVSATPEAIGSFTFDQVLSHAAARQDENVSRIEAQIDPPDLGRMWIEISKSPEGMTAHLTVEDPSVLALMDQQMREVQQNLEAAGVPVASFTLSMGSDRQSSQQQSHRDEEQDSTPTVIRSRTNVAPRSNLRHREIDTTA